MRKKSYKKKGSVESKGNGIAPSGGLPGIAAPFGTMVRPSKPRLTLNTNSGEIASPTAVSANIIFSLVPPYDDQQSFGKNMNEWYLRMRAVNAGATNYNTTVLASYFTIVRALRVAHIQASMALQAMGANEPNFVNNAAHFYYLCGGRTYAADTLEAANYQNALITLGKEIEALPLPNMAIFDRDMFALGSVIREKRGRRSSYAAPVVCDYYYAGLALTDGAWVPVPASLTIQANSTTTRRIAELISIMQSLLNTISTTYIYSTLRGDMVKTFGLGAYHIDLLKYLSEGLHIREDLVSNRIIQNASLRCFTAPTVAWDSSNQEYTVAATGTASLVYPGDNNNVYPMNVDTGTPEEAYWYSIFCLFTAGSPNNYVYQRGYLLRNIVFMGNGSTTSATTRRVLSLALNDAQNSTVQSTAEAAHTDLANITTLWESCPAYCPDSGSTIAGHWDDLEVFTRADLLNMITQAIRADTDSRAFVAQSNAARSK